MNKNDLRANAYINALKSGNSDTGKKEKSEVKPFIPPRVQSKSENKQKNENQENKPLFRDVNKKVGKILETQATDYLKSGGLIKVPVADKQSDGKDSVILYLKRERLMKKLPAARNVKINQQLIELLNQEYGAENVKVVEKSIEKQTNLH